MDDSTDSANFSVLRGYLPLIQKDPIIHMHHLAVYVKEGLPFARDLSLKNSADSYYVFDWLYLTQCLTSFFSIDHHFLCHYAQFLILFHLTWIRFSRSIHLRMCLSLGTLTPIIGTG